jgi:hypothetical protein
MHIVKKLLQIRSDQELCARLEIALPFILCSPHPVERWLMRLMQADYMADSRYSHMIDRAIVVASFSCAEIHNVITIVNGEDNIAQAKYFHRADI